MHIIHPSDQTGKRGGTRGEHPQLVPRACWLVVGLIEQVRCQSRGAVRAGGMESEASVESTEAVRRVVIIGASTGGASAADGLRRAGFDGEITVIGEEPELPYDRPQLSKGYLVHGDAAEDKLFLRPPEYYAQQRVTMRLGETATALDASRRAVTLASGEQLGYDRLIIATGGEAVRLNLPGADLAGIYYLRTLADARTLSSALAQAQAERGHIVVIGAGFIGSEVAAACRMRGIEVTLLDILATPLERVLGPEVGALYAASHRQRGVRLRMGEGVVAFHGQRHVEAVETTAGDRIACTHVVVGIGMRPRTAWLAHAGLSLDGGVLVDEHCETSIPGIFAIGDIARWPYRVPGSDPAQPPAMVRLEHWDTALRQGDIAARNALGDRVPFAAVPYFWSDQYDVKLHYVGLAEQWDEVVLRGNPAEESYLAFYLRDHIVLAAFAVNRARDLVAMKRILGLAPDAAALADDSEPLKSVVSRIAAL